MKNIQKILIIGGGSIGQRHLGNLKALGIRNVAIVETNPSRIEDLKKKYSVPVFTSIKKATQTQKFTAAFICTPTIHHFKNTLICAEQELDLFIEKPISNTLKGMDNLERLVKKHQLITMIGSNWKFYPLFQKMKKLLDSGCIGKILSVRCEFGQYLPDWHPWEDYRKGYSANRKLGGGILLDSHEFDYITWFLGDKVKKIACFSKRVSSLKIDVEDTAVVILEFLKGALGEIHLDYVQRFYQRNFEFFGEKGTIIWDSNFKKIILKSKTIGEKSFFLPDKYDLNKMYIQEAKHFLACVQKRKETITPISKGIEVLKLIMAAKKSAVEDTSIFL